jgi:hypothetical protein
MREELGALHRLIERQRALVAAQPKKFTKEDADLGRDREARREFARLDSWTSDEREYAAYLQSLANLLALDPARLNPAAVKIEDLIPKGAMGDHNTLHELQSYVVGPAPAGLVLAPDGSLDMGRSFVRVDYFSRLGGLSVRNNVQPSVESRPVDFVAVRVPEEALRGALAADERPDQAVWLYGAPDRQALILSREEGGRLALRYLPVSNLKQSQDGRVTFERAGWRAGLPLKLWEDARLTPAGGEVRGRWLGDWHTDLEWLRATHLTRYSNAVVGLHEQLARHTVEGTDDAAANLSVDERLLRRFRMRQRVLVETDLLILANDHWNFDVRGFNPGGNHGSFFRNSTHSTLMLAGGDDSGVPRGLAVEEPYDSLSLMPTLLTLTGQLEEGERPVPVLWRRGFRAFPGRVVRELFDAPPADAPFADTTTPEARP